MFGSDPPHKSIDETTAAEFRELLNLNLISYFLTSKVSSQTNEAEKTWII